MRAPVKHRNLAGQPSPTAEARAAAPIAEALAAAAPAATAAPATVSFARDIRPMFEPFAAAMGWRFDLTDYTAVMANAQTIFERISSTGNPMPPPPFPMLSSAQIQRFQAWMNDGCQP